MYLQVYICKKRFFFALPSTLSKLPECFTNMRYVFCNFGLWWFKTWSYSFLLPYTLLSGMCTDQVQLANHSACETITFGVYMGKVELATWKKSGGEDEKSVRIDEFMSAWIDENVVDIFKCRFEGHITRFILFL